MPDPTPPHPSPSPRFTLNPREDVPHWQPVLLGLLCVALLLGLWYLATEGKGDERWISRTKLPSPAETFGSFKSLWYERFLTVNMVASLWRVIKGFTLAVLVGVPV